MYQLQMFLHRDTDNLCIGQCWHTLHNSHLHHKNNWRCWLHHCNDHFRPALRNHNLKIGAKYILINVIWVVEIQRWWILKSKISCLKPTYFQLSNNCEGWNKRGGGAKVAKSINLEVGINMEGGTFWKKIVNKRKKRGLEGGNPRNQ